MRFQEAVTGSTVYADSPVANGAPVPPATVAAASPLDPPTLKDPSGPDGAALIDATPRAAASAALPDVVWNDGGASAATASTSCTEAPTASITARSLKGGKLTLSGTAAAPCGTVKAVDVALVSAAKGKCRVVRANGALSKAYACAAKAPAFLVAHGTAKWSLKLTGKLARGAYTVSARAVDKAGTTQSKVKAVSFKVH